MAGYAVVDLETTGLFPGGHDRIVEVGVVLVSPDGEVEDTWETLLNPGRDLGRQDIHGIRAADVLGAPTFPDVAATLAELLGGRTFVAHNAAFDSRIVAARYGWFGYEVPVAPETSVCTMQWGSRLLGCRAPSPARARTSAWSSATTTPPSPTPRLPPVCCVCESATRAVWPAIPGAACTCVRCGNATERAVHYLARLVDSLPEPCGVGARPSTSPCWTVLSSIASCPCASRRGWWWPRVSWGSTNRPLSVCTVPISRRLPERRSPTAW